MASKLTEDQVLEIYQDFLYGDMQKTIADKFGVTKGTVNEIVNGHRWGYVTGLKTPPTVEELANGKPFAPIPGHPNNYITTDGVVIGKIRGQAFLRVISPNKDGYKCCYMRTQGRSSKTEYVHQLLCLTFKADSYFKGAEVRHLDGNPANINLDNLKWGTHKENMEDMVLHGRAAHGEQKVNSKLTETNVHDIRDMLDEGLTQRELAVRFNVAQTTISAIANGYNWAWLT